MTDELELLDEDEGLEEESGEDELAPAPVGVVFVPPPIRDTTVPGNGQLVGRLDHYLMQAFPGFSRSAFQGAIKSGTIKLNGLPTKASAKVKGGDHLVVQLPKPPHPMPLPENIPLDILYEDEYLAVINKPPNMVVHPAKGNWSGTLVNALRYHFQQLSGINGDYRPGIVHRLDRDTSGAILIAKEENAHRHLSMQFETRKVYKEYHVLCQGVLQRDSDYVEKALGPHPKVREKTMIFNYVDEAKGIRPACTYYEVIERFNGYCYCRAFPKTGRTHQIRVHLAFAGATVLADKLYLGQPEFLLSHLVPGLGEGEDRPLLTRQALHAHRLRFTHPFTGKWMEVVAPLPDQMADTLEQLRKYASLKAT